LLAGALGLPQAAADELIVLYRTGRGSESDACLSQARYSTAAAVPDTSDVGRATPGGLAAPAPRQLPAVLAHFVGRSAELNILDDLLEQALSSPAGPGQVVVAAISGAAGVGKTALAVHWAYRATDGFPGRAVVCEPARI
jgi:hypothetical protein